MRRTSFRTSSSDRAGMELASRHGNRFKYLAYDVVGSGFFGFGLVRQNDTMPQDVERHVLHVLRGHISAPDDKGIGAGTQAQVDRRPRRRAVLDERLEIIETVPFGMPGCRDDVQHV